MRSHFRIMQRIARYFYFNILFKGGTRIRITQHAYAITSALEESVGTLPKLPN